MPTKPKLASLPKHLCVRLLPNVGFEDPILTPRAIALQGIRQADLQLRVCIVVIGLGHNDHDKSLRMIDSTTSGFNAHAGWHGSNHGSAQRLCSQ